MKKILFFVLLLGGFLYADEYICGLVRTTYINDCSFSIVWTTNCECKGFVKYWKTVNSPMFSYDERGSDYRGFIHFVTVSGLEPQTEYYFLLTDGTRYFDNSGKPFVVETGPILSIPSPNQVYGKVLFKDESPAKDAVVFLQIKDNNKRGSTGCSQSFAGIVNEEGYWTLNLGGIRDDSFSSYFLWSKGEDVFEITVFTGPCNCFCYTVSSNSTRPIQTLYIEK